MLRTASLLAFIICLSAPACALAQNSTTNENLKPEDCDFSFTSTVRAKELKVDVVGHPRVRFTGSKNRETLFDSNRSGFPKPVKPGVTYKNIKIDTKILTRFTEPNSLESNSTGNSAEPRNGAENMGRSAPAEQGQTAKPTPALEPELAQPATQTGTQENGHSPAGTTKDFGRNAGQPPAQAPSNEPAP